MEGSGYIVMDTETGSAGYVISGGLAGGSTAINVGVTLIGLAALTWAIVDTISIAVAFLAATSPIMMIILFSVYVFSIINVIMTLDTSKGKIGKQQANSFILNLDDFSGSMDDLVKQFYD